MYFIYLFIYQPLKVNVDVRRHRTTYFIFLRTGRSSLVVSYLFDFKSPAVWINKFNSVMITYYIHLFYGFSD